MKISSSFNYLTVLNIRCDTAKFYESENRFCRVIEKMNKFVWVVIKYLYNNCVLISKMKAGSVWIKGRNKHVFSETVSERLKMWKWTNTINESIAAIGFIHMYVLETLVFRMAPFIIYVTLIFFNLFKTGPLHDNWYNRIVWKPGKYLNYTLQYYHESENYHSSLNVQLALCSSFQFVDMTFAR